MLRLILTFSFLAPAGCTMLPEVIEQPVVHNPFPQLSKVAVAPFINLSTEAAVDGRQFALAYFEELQQVPGFEVVPIGVVEQAMTRSQNRLATGQDAQRLAQELGVDALIVGAVTDFSPYYPPRCGLRVEWYSANSCFHPIPPGYGLPWGTEEEQDIPQRLLFEAEMALARAQLATQTPSTGQPPDAAPEAAVGGDATARTSRAREAAQQTVSGGTSVESTPTEAIAGSHSLPPGWPDPRGFVPPPPQPVPPPCIPSEHPVLEHTALYAGNDAGFTSALARYYAFRDEARFGGWQSYLQRSEDFIRFCCHVHIAEMLTARGGADETRVVWRWSASR